MEKRVSKFLALFIILLLLANLIPIIKASDSTQDQAYYTKLISSGLTREQADSIVAKYPTENDLLAAVRQAVSSNEQSLEGIPISLFYTNFYKPGVVTTWFNNWWKNSSIFDSINSFFKGLFGTTLSGFFSWLIGIQRDNSVRILDLIVGFLTAFLIALLFKITYENSYYNG